MGSCRAKPGGGAAWNQPLPGQVRFAVDTTKADYSSPASASQLEALAERLRERNFEVAIVETGADAKAEVLKRIPEGASIDSGKSKTLEDMSLWKELMESERYDFIRRRTSKMDRTTQDRKS